MKKIYKDILSTPIVDFQTGELLALFKDLIIDDQTGKIEAIWVIPAQKPFNFGVITVDQIMSWGQKLYIKGNHSISHPEEILKIKAILERNNLVIGQPTYNESEKYLGNVTNLIFDTKDYLIEQLIIKKEFLIFKWSEKWIPKNRIIEIKPGKIIVDDSLEVLKDVVEEVDQLAA